MYVSNFIIFKVFKNTIILFGLCFIIIKTTDQIAEDEYQSSTVINLESNKITQTSIAFDVVSTAIRGKHSNIIHISNFSASKENNANKKRKLSGKLNKMDEDVEKVINSFNEKNFLNHLLKLKFELFSIFNENKNLADNITSQNDGTKKLIVSLINLFFVYNDDLNSEKINCDFSVREETKICQIIFPDLYYNLTKIIAGYNLKIFEKRFANYKDPLTYDQQKKLVEEFKKSFLFILEGHKNFIEILHEFVQNYINFLTVRRIRVNGIWKICSSKNINKLTNDYIFFSKRNYKILRDYIDMLHIFYADTNHTLFYKNMKFLLQLAMSSDNFRSYPQFRAHFFIAHFIQDKTYLKYQRPNKRVDFYPLANLRLKQFRTTKAFCDDLIAGLANIATLSEERKGKFFFESTRIDRFQVVKVHSRHYFMDVNDKKMHYSDLELCKLIFKTLIYG